MYADDTTILLHDLTDSIENKTNSMLNSLNQWFISNKLFLNSSKTKYTTFYSNPLYSQNQFNLFIGNNVIENTNSIKALGIMFSSDLKWNEHINEINLSISKATYKLKHLRALTTLDVLKMVYSSDIESRLRYGIILWGSSTLSKKS